VTAPLRHATAADIPEVLELYGRVYPERRGSSFAQRGRYLAHLLVENPWAGEGLPSLVYTGPGGHVIGFLGVLARRVSFQGRARRMAVSHHFMVDPAFRRTLAAVSLLKAFLAGAQDLSICEPADPAIWQMWEALGGRRAFLWSLCWTRPLRPASHLGRALQQRLPRGVARLASTAGWIADAAMGTAFTALDPPGASRAATERIESAELVDWLREFSGGSALAPVYETADLDWILAVLREKPRRGQLRHRLVRSASSEVLGVFVYYAIRDAVSQVVQIGARRGAGHAVLDALARDAHGAGAIALSGRFDPQLADELATGIAYFRLDDNRVLVHSRDAEIERAVLAGDAVLSRLETEWWLAFDDGIEYSVPRRASAC
jgi:hypothetical protein